MDIKFPHLIENFAGEKLIFLELIKEPGGDRVIVENFVAPDSGPVMHTHFLQDESLTVVTGRLAYQISGQETQYATAGQTVLFERGTPHRFWNAGKETLNCTGWIKPANSIVYFLSSIYTAQNKAVSLQPEKFDGAYLMTRYASEYDLPEIPRFVKKVLMPITYYIGRLLGRYKHFKDAPEPVKK